MGPRDDHALFTNHRFANNGLPLRGGDVGREKVTLDPADRGKFKTPSLRNVALTGPYMHDGRLRTLEDVVEHCKSGVERSPTLDPNLAKHPTEGPGLSKPDLATLVAFLRTLTEVPAAAARLSPR
jgi:cytochrome c peroxidase